MSRRRDGMGARPPCSPCASRLGGPKTLSIQTRHDHVDRYMGSADHTRFVAEQVAEQNVQVGTLGLAAKN
jgi:hypothetical protein